MEEGKEGEISRTTPAETAAGTTRLFFGGGEGGQGRSISLADHSRYVRRIPQLSRVESPDCRTRGVAVCTQIARWGSPKSSRERRRQAAAAVAAKVGPSLRAVASAIDLRRLPRQLRNPTIVPLLWNNLIGEPSGLDKPSVRCAVAKQMTRLCLSIAFVR